MRVSRRRFWGMIGLVALLVATFIASLHIGAVSATPEILTQLRLPRVLLGGLVGAALATAGVIYQGLLRNPLADPYILGTSSGASLGVLVAVYFNLQGTLRLYALALGFALVSIVAVHRIAQTHGKTPVQTLILSGVLVSTFLNALVFLIISLFYKEAFSALFFLLGTLTESDPTLVRVSAVLIVVGFSAAWFLATDLNALSQGEETAFHLGVQPERMRTALFFVASLLVSASVAASGMIGFVGLMVPHILRLLVGPDHRRLLPAAALGGASFLILMDAAARTLAAPIEIPVGVLTALCGTPFLIYLLRRRKGEVF